MKERVSKYRHSLFSLCVFMTILICMKASILYHPNAEFSRMVEQYVKDFARFHQQEIELVSLETREGADMARLYDIVRYPALLVVDGRNALARQWQGDKLPLMDEVVSYLRR